MLQKKHNLTGYATEEQHVCKARTAEKTLSKNGIAATFRFHEGGKRFIIASTLLLKVWGGEVSL